MNLRNEDNLGECSGFPQGEIRSHGSLGGRDNRIGVRKSSFADPEEPFAQTGPR